MMEVFRNDPENLGFARLYDSVRYSAKSEECVLTVVTPTGKNRRSPFIVFVQGSGWQHPNVNNQLPQLCRLAQDFGIASAAVVHRNAGKGNPYPAYLEDVKCALRFMRANADKYRLDIDRAGVWGTSSGGNTALLMGLTGDSAEFDRSEYPDMSDAVKLVVDCFGPSDLPGFMDIEGMVKENNPLLLGLAGNNDPMDVARKMSPLFRIENGIKYPPMLLIHGDCDPLVPFDQSERMYAALTANGNEAQLIKVTGAEHEGSFWSKPLLDRIFEFIAERI